MIDEPPTEEYVPWKDRKLDRNAYRREIAARKRARANIPAPAVIEARTAAVEQRMMSDREIIEALNRKVRLGLEALTQEKINDLKGKDAAIVLGIMIDKHLLMQGRPTAIVSLEDSRKLPELARAVVREAMRRGIVIDGEAEVVDDVRPRVFAPADTE